MPPVARTQPLPHAFFHDGTKESKKKGIEKTSSFSVDKAVAHIANKADYKSLGNGQQVKGGRLYRLKKWAIGNTADDRGHRGKYEATQLVSAAVCADEFRLNLGNTGPHQQLDIQQSELVRSRFARQDNLRYSPKLTGTRYGLNNMGKVAIWASRIAHWCNGITELAAAPTGLLLKISKILVQPKHEDRCGWGHFRVLAALVLVTGTVAIVSFGLFRELIAEQGLAPALTGIARDLALSLIGVVASFSAVALLGALGALAFSGISAMAAMGIKISPQIAAQIERDKNTHTERLFQLMQRVHENPGLKPMVADAMRGSGLTQKISANYLNDNGRPKLLDMLLQATEHITNKEEGALAVQKVLGRYMVLRDVGGEEAMANALDPENDAAELLSRELHVVAATNLIEHIRIAEDERGGFKDMRHRLDCGAQHIKTGVLEDGLAKAFDYMGLKSWADTMRNVNDPEWQKQRGKDKLDSAKAQDMRFSLDQMLDNPHQYGAMTVRLARAAEAVRLFNTAVVLSFNYQLTRPFAWACSMFTQHVLNMPPCRCVSFSVGRAVSSGAWAALDSFLFISLAGGAGVGNAYPTGSQLEKTLPLHVEMPTDPDLQISVISTGAQMLLLGLFCAPIVLMAKLSVCAGGWKGNSSRNFEPVNSSRKPVYL